MNQYDKRHLANVRRYQRKIDDIYKRAAEQAAARAATLPVPDDYIFTFDDFPAVKLQIEALLSDMQANIELTVTNGVRAEWDLANEKNDALVDSVLGDAAKLARYHRTHEEALGAFLQRKKNGLGLSDNVWRYTNQFKDEIEMGLDLGIRQGMDAASIARSIQQYLKYPDMLFRRVKDEHGIFQLSQRAAAFHPGQGVYRSSYKNALRLAATETNIAYRTADHERWQDFDFIVGIEVHLSNNHTVINHKKERVPLVDICDALQGKYPKQFKFVGWHPNCRCIAVPINKTKDEVKADMERIRNGERPSDPSASENYVKDMPEGFTAWMNDNAERIESAKSLPYFIADNFKDGDVSQGLRWIEEKQLTPAEIRHMNRTPEQEQAIRDAWNARKEENRLIMEAANKVNMKAIFLWREVDATRLNALLSNPTNVNAIKKEMRSVAKQISEQRARERALVDLIPNAHELHSSQFTLKELEEAHAAIKRTFNRWTWDLDSDASLQFLKGRLEREIQVVANSPYKTKDIAKAAFEQRLAIVERRIKANKVKSDFAGAFDFAKKTRSKVVKDLLAEINTMIADDTVDVFAIRKKAAELNQKTDILIARQAARKAKAVNIPVGSMTAAEVRDEMVKMFASAGHTIKAADIVIEDGCVLLSERQHDILSRLCNVTKNEISICRRHGDGGYIGTSNSFTINGVLRDVKGRGANMIIGDVRSNPRIKIAADKYGSKLKTDDLLTIETLDSVIGRNKLPFPIKVLRNLDEDGIIPLFGGRINAASPAKAMNEIVSLTDKRMTPDAGFMSVSSNAQQNVFKHRDYQLQIEVPQGTPIYVTGNSYESECILGRMTELIFKSVEYKNSTCIIKCVVK